MFLSHPENTVFDLQRLLGRNMDDEGFLGDVKHWPFQVNGEGDEPVIRVQYRHEPRDFTPEEIMGTIMGKMKEMAQAYTGQVISHAVITVPAGAYLLTHTAYVLLFQHDTTP
jgi:molecular chaperone DnaK (HSP70)